MHRFSRLGRLAAAAALVASGATVALTSTAGAANTNLTIDCVQQNTTASVDNSDTVTITISGSNCGFIVLNNPGLIGPLGTATLNSFPLTAGNPMGVSDGDVVVYTAPASGSGQDGFVFLPTLQSPPGAQVHILFPPVTGSIVDNGDGTATVTYSGEVVLFLMQPGATCPPNLFGPPTGLAYFADSALGSPAPLPASPAALSTSSMMDPPGSGSGLQPVAAGTYPACLLDIMGGSLITSGSVTLGSAAPTTTTTAGTDPVTPAFTG